MKAFGLRLTLRLALFALAGASTGHAADLPFTANDAVPAGNCNWCHGTGAQGFSVAPRIAGQTEQYIERQIRGFGAHKRDNPYSAKFMWNAVADLPQPTAHELAAYYAALPPRAARDGNPNLFVAGKKLYDGAARKGDAEACAFCHGANAEGEGAIPRLGGLSYLYLKNRLAQWREGFHEAAKPMPQISKDLSNAEIEALASYLSFVE